MSLKMVGIKKTSTSMIAGMSMMIISNHGFAAADVSQGEVLASACYSCHGVEGVGSKKIPELNTLTKQDITESLFGFKSGEEHSTIMGRYMEAYTDKEIEILANYLSSLKN